MDQNKPQTQSTEKQQVVDAIKNGQNVLITVSQNPSVDQLATCIGLTLLLNKLDKHATAVFSGTVPPAMNFLEPEKTLEANTNSLRDFIIALDRSKADKLRYKVEDNFVRIFITPYRTSINEADLEFSQGDFNVDVVVALGVDQREHLDMAIMENGRILHDAVVIGLSCGQSSTVVGSLNWHENNASSLAEMVVSISESFKSGVIDSQMATAFLTGIVAETDRFRNEKTTPKTMTMSAQLMAAGANQQLIASELAPSSPVNASVKEEQIISVNPEEAKEHESVSEPLAVNTEIKINPGAEEDEKKEESSDASINLMDKIADGSEENENNIRKIKIDSEGKLHEDNTTQEDDLTAEPVQGYINNGGHKVIQPLTDQPSETKNNPYFSEKPTNSGSFTSVNSVQATDMAPNPLETNLPSPPGIMSHESNDSKPEEVSLPSAPIEQVPEPTSSQVPEPYSSQADPITAPGSAMESQMQTNPQLDSPNTGFPENTYSQPVVESSPILTENSNQVDNIPSPVVDTNGQVTNYEEPDNNVVNNQISDQEAARRAVLEAIAANPSSTPQPPIEALNSQPINLDAQPTQQTVNQFPVNPNPPPVPPPIMPFNNQPGVNQANAANESRPASNNPFNLPPVQN